MILSGYRIYPLIIARIIHYLSGDAIINLSLIDKKAYLAVRGFLGKKTYQLCSIEKKFYEYEQKYYLYSSILKPLMPQATIYSIFNCTWRNGIYFISFNLKVEPFLKKHNIRYYYDGEEKFDLPLVFMVNHQEIHKYTITYAKNAEKPHKISQTSLDAYIEKMPEKFYLCPHKDVSPLLECLYNEKCFPKICNYLISEYNILKQAVFLPKDKFIQILSLGIQYNAADCIEDEILYRDIDIYVRTCFNYGLFTSFEDIKVLHPYSYIVKRYDYFTPDITSNIEQLKNMGKFFGEKIKSKESLETFEIMSGAFDENDPLCIYFHAVWNTAKKYVS